MRYAIVNHYYTPCSSGTVGSPEFRNGSSEFSTLEIRSAEQKAIHPSLKKLIGKRPLSEIVIGSRTTRKATSEAQKEMKKELTQKRRKTRSQETVEDLPIVQLTSSRGKNQLRHLIVVGNTSQFLNERSSSKITHKWMCYIRTKTRVPIERLVAKVRFYLDSSYKPNEVIDVSAPPFSITKRGYGEFSIQLLVFFRDDVQMKPFKTFHQLVLDRKMTGHQTLGNETISELWTRNFFTDEFPDAIVEASKSDRSHLMDHDYLKSAETVEDLDEAETKVKVKVENNKIDCESLKDPETRDVIEWIEKNFPIIPTEEKYFSVDVE